MKKQLQQMFFCDNRAAGKPLPTNEDCWRATITDGMDSRALGNSALG